jgi:hypothetical protein
LQKDSGLLAAITYYDFEKKIPKDFLGDIFGPYDALIIGCFEDRGLQTYISSQFSDRSDTNTYKKSKSFYVSFDRQKEISWPLEKIDDYHKATGNRKLMFGQDKKLLAKLISSREVTFRASGIQGPLIMKFNTSDLIKFRLDFVSRGCRF